MIEVLKINLSESDLYIWTSPKQGLDDYYSGKVLLAPPQVQQFNHFSGIPQIKLLEKFYKEDLRQNSQSLNELERSPFYFPIIFYFKKTSEKEFYWIMPGDHEYPIDKIAKNEESEELKKEILEKYKTLKWEKPQVYRILAGFDENKKLMVKACIFQKSFISVMEGLKEMKFPLLEKPKL